MIATNAGMEGSLVVARLRDEKRATFGFNAATMEYEDLMAPGIIDPAKVTRSALQNAASIAAMLLTTEACVADLPEEKKDMPHAGRRRRHGRHVLDVGFRDVSAQGGLLRGAALFVVNLRPAGGGARPLARPRVHSAPAAPAAVVARMRSRARPAASPGGGDGGRGGEVGRGSGRRHGDRAWRRKLPLAGGAGWPRFCACASSRSGNTIRPAVAAWRRCCASCARGCSTAGTR